MQDTLVSLLFDSPATTGAVSSVQAVPFHDSMSAPTSPFRLASPTATQNEGEMQETPANKLAVDPEGAGAGCVDQSVPVRASTKGVQLVPLELGR
jgi:hypothetical protein